MYILQIWTHKSFQKWDFSHPSLLLVSGSVACLVGFSWTSSKITFPSAFVALSSDFDPIDGHVVFHGFSLPYLVARPTTFSTRLVPKAPLAARCPSLKNWRHFRRSDRVANRAINFSLASRRDHDAFHESQGAPDRPFGFRRRAFSRGDSRCQRFNWKVVNLVPPTPLTRGLLTR